MANDKREDPLLRAGRRAKRAAMSAVGLGQANAPDEAGAAENFVSTQPNLSQEGIVVESILFTPGTGGMTRHIAGRRHEMLVLGRIVQALKRHATPPHDAVLHGSEGSARPWRSLGWRAPPSERVCA